LDLLEMPAPVDAAHEAAPPHAEFPFLYIEKLPLAPVDAAQAATKNVANEGAHEVPDDALESRLGQAMHRLLEWVPVVAGGHAAQADVWSAGQWATLRQDYAIDTSQCEAVRASALAIVAGEGRWVWDAAALAWHGSEVALSAGGRLLRLDRLVQHRETGQWWVLDYKSTRTPLAQPLLCAQLDQYRTAVSRAYPGAAVRTAFLTPDGALQEWTGQHG
jgi:ATP-dependent helicase/nuclease subunit A